MPSLSSAPARPQSPFAKGQRERERESKGRDQAAGSPFIHSAEGEHHVLNTNRLREEGKFQEEGEKREEGPESLSARLVVVHRSLETE